MLPIPLPIPLPSYLTATVLYSYGKSEKKRKVAMDIVLLTRIAQIANIVLLVVPLFAFAKGDDPMFVFGKIIGVVGALAWAVLAVIACVLVVAICIAVCFFLAPLFLVCFIGSLILSRSR